MSKKVLRKGEKLTTDWQLITNEQVRSSPAAAESVLVNVSVFHADYQTRDGFVHVSGARRVVAVNVETGKSHQRPQSFYGETAWSDADRAFGDIVSELRYAR